MGCEQAWGGRSPGKEARRVSPPNPQGNGSQARGGSEGASKHSPLGPAPPPRSPDSVGLGRGLRMSIFSGFPGAEMPLQGRHIENPAPGSVESHSQGRRSEAGRTGAPPPLPEWQTAAVSLREGADACRPSDPCACGWAAHQPGPSWDKPRGWVSPSPCYGQNPGSQS